VGKGDIPQDEVHCFIENLERMAMQLPLVEELGFVRPFESS
jgi:hypothetical protein